MSGKAFEEALQAVSNIVQKDHPFHIMQPLWVHGDNMNCWIAVGFFKAAWSEWYCAAVPEDHLEAQPTNIPCSWLTDLCPGEQRYANVVRLDDWRRK